MNQNNYVAIMAGGVGSRFWPMSRTAFPKQFLDILHVGKTLLQATYERFLTFIPNENIFIVTSEEYVPIVKNQLPLLPAKNIIAEPEPKNTAPCIALISMKLKKLNPEANLIVAPSDHLIQDEVAFKNDCLQALRFTEESNAFVTFGIQPSYANTGYGYIQMEQEENEESIFKVKRFTEKPNKETAVAFLKEGAYLWNSGIFVWKVASILRAFNLYMPEMYDFFVNGMSDLNTKNEAALIKFIYNNFEPISIDYAILEKAKNVFVIPASFGWSDLGTWTSAWENIEKDEAQNAIAGINIMLADTNNCMVHSTNKKLIMLGGVQDLIVVNTPDVLLVCKKENEQQVKDYLAMVKDKKGQQYI